MDPRDNRLPNVPSDLDNIEVTVREAVRAVSGVTLSGTSTDGPATMSAAVVARVNELVDRIIPTPGTPWHPTPPALAEHRG